MASCGATSERVVGGCEEIKNMLSNCVESMAGLAPPAYDELDKIQLPSFRVRTSEICKVSQGSQLLLRLPFCAASNLFIAFNRNICTCNFSESSLSPLLCLKL